MRDLKIGAMMLCMGMFASAAAWGQALSVSIEVEEGTYIAGDPVNMIVTVTNVSPQDCDGPILVDVHLTPDANFGTDNDHRLTTLSGPGLAPGQSFTWIWVQMMPGQFDGAFFVHAFAESANNCTGVVSPFGLEDAKVRLVGQNHPETSLVSISDAGNLGDDISETPSISRDGRWIAFASSATTLLGGQMVGEGEDAVFVTPINNAVPDIFVRDQWTGEIERITWPVSGNDPDGPSMLPRLSGDADARWVAFHSSASNLIPEQVTNNVADVYLHDRQTGEHILVSRGIDGKPGNGVSRSASVSADGRWVAFESEASNLVSGDSNNRFDIFVMEIEDGQIQSRRRVNVTNQGVQAIGGPSRNARISDDGRHIVFESQATNLGTGGKAGLWEVYVHDRDANHTGIFDQPGGIATRRLSVDYDFAGNPIFSDGHSFEANLSPNGRFVTFTSGATSLFSEPATGSIVIDGKAMEATVRFEKNLPGAGNINFKPDEPATGTIEFLANPADGETLQISDGVLNHTFEFVEPGNSASPGRIRVTLGANSLTSRNSLITMINRHFVEGAGADEEQTMLAAPEEFNGNPGIRITNLTRGMAGNNQPIDDGSAPSLSVTGMGGAVIDLPASGETLIIDNNRTPPVTVRFFESGEADPTDLGGRILGVEIGRTAKETSLNLLEVFHGLGYDEYDLPNLPAHWFSPLGENPRDGDILRFTREVEDEDGELEVIETVFTFVATGPQLNLLNPTEILIGETVEETRGNLLRVINFLFDFDPLPAVVEATGEPFVLGQTLEDTVAEGSINLMQVPEPGHNIVVGDGELTTTFEFRDERDQTEQEEELDIPVPPFEVINPELVVVYLVDGLTVPGAAGRLLGAIQASALNVTAEMADGNIIELIHNEVGPIGNVPIEKAPVRTAEEIDEGEEPWVEVEGMDGGGLNDIAVEGGRIVFYPDNLLHPRTIFEFREDLEDLSNDAHFGVRIGATGAESEGNFLEVLYQSGLPRVIAVEGDEVLPIVRLESQIGAAGGVITFDFTASNQAPYDALTQEPGAVRAPAHGGTITVNDGMNSLTFEFTADGTFEPGNIPLTLSQVVAANRDNLIQAVNDAENLNVEAFDATVGDDTRVRLIRTVPGLANLDVEDFVVAENVGPWVEVVDRVAGRGNPLHGETFTLRDGINDPVTFVFVDPEDPDDPQVDPDDPSQIEIAFDGQVPDRIDLPHRTRDNLIAAIKETGLHIDAAPFTQNGRPGARLTHFSTGRIGNFPITVGGFDVSISVKGMSGGGSLAEGVEQVYLVDRDANDNGIFDETGHMSLELISKTPLGTGANRISGDSVVSADGRYVAFRSQADDLLPLTVTRSDGEVFSNIVDSSFFMGGVDEEGNLILSGIDMRSEIHRFTDIDDFPDIYLFDRETGEHRRVNVNRFGESKLASSNYELVVNGPHSSRRPAMSADGRFITFEFDASNLWHGATNLDMLDLNPTRDVYVHDRRFPSSGLEFEGVVVLEDPTETDPAQTDPHPITVGTTVPLRATVSDLEPGRTVSSVEFFANGVSVGVAGAPILPNGLVVGNTREFDFSVNWTPGQEQPYNLTAEATDSRGRVLPLSNLVRLTVRAQSQNPPSVTILFPPATFVDDEGDEEEEIPGGLDLTNQSTVPFIAQATPGNTSIDRVAFYFGGVFIGNAERETASGQTSDSNVWRLNFDLSEDFLGDDLPVAPGVYQLLAVAWDENDNSVSSNPVNVTVTNPSGDEPMAQQPVLDISLEDIWRGQGALLTLIPHGDQQLTQVRFFANGRLISGQDDDDDDNGAGAGLTFFWNPTTSGTYTLMATARDSFGNLVISNILEGIVVRDNEPPVVTLISPQDQTPPISYRVGDQVVLLADARAVSPGDTIASVVFFADGNQVAVGERQGDTNRYRAVWTPQVARGEVQIRARAQTAGSTFEPIPGDDDDGDDQQIAVNRPLTAFSARHTITIGTFFPIPTEGDFVTTIYDDMLRTEEGLPRSEADVLRRQMEDGTFNRVDFIADLMEREEFREIVHIFGAYEVVLARIPSRFEIDLDLLLVREDGFTALIEQLFDDPRFRQVHGRTREQLEDADMPSPEITNFVKRLASNSNRSLSSLELVQEVNGILVGEFGGDLVDYTAAFVLGEDLELPPNISLPKGVTSERKRRYEASALVFALLERIPTSAELDVLQKLSRRNLIREIMQTPTFQNRFPDWFGGGISEAPLGKSSWFGAYHDDNFNYSTNTGWIKSEEHGWWFRPANARSWVFDDIIDGWIWTNEGIYPFIYSDKHNTWLYYEKGGNPNSRWFYFYNSATWQEVTK